jgi:hypothetical protein
MSNCEDRWNRDKTFGLDVVPLLSAGADTRPRIINGKYPANGWSQEPTPDELGRHVTQALHWVDSNPGVDPARLFLIYAWNEFDEGGWICPTLYNGADRLDAIRKALNVYDKR